MRFTPKSEREIAEDGLLQPGVYDFEVAEAEERVSKNNNDMIALKLFVYDDKGSRRLVRDWLLEIVPGKLRNFAAAVGAMDDYQKGQMRAADLVGRPGKVKLGIRKDPSGQFSDQNDVKDYVRPDAAGSNGFGRGAPPIIDDEIPFTS
jgi:hypothetical protein